jgi:hypothetical protein
MRTDNVTINGKFHLGITSPLVAQSRGLGRRNGVAGFKEYLESKIIGMAD